MFSLNGGADVCTDVHDVKYLAFQFTLFETAKAELIALIKIRQVICFRVVIHLSKLSGRTHNLSGISQQSGNK